VNRRGVALLSALVAMLLAGALAGLALAAARLSWVGGVRQVALAQARAVAVGSAARRTAEWDPVLADSLAVGEAAGLGGYVVAPGVSSRDSLLRLGPDLYLVRSAGETTLGSGEVVAREVVARLLERLVLHLPDSAAIIAPRVDLEGAGVVVSGADHLPPAGVAGCPPPAPPREPVAPDSLALADREVLVRLVPTADFRLAGSLRPVPAVDGAGRCDLVSPLNWGDPAGGPCAGRYPVVVLEPGTALVGGVGQGLLIALGSLELSGNFCFTGAIVALGAISMSGRSCVEGVIVGLDGVTVKETARVERSVCALRRAERAPRSFEPAPRAWSRWR
jgi:hypothetical protein